MLAWPLLRDDLAKVSVLSLEPATPQTTGTKFSSVLTSVRQIANSFADVVLQLLPLITIS